MLSTPIGLHGGDKMDTISRVLAPTGKATFSLSTSSSCDETAFKVRSMAQNATRNRMRNQNADAQSGLIFNGAQNERFLDQYIMALPRDAKIWKLFCEGAPEPPADDDTDINSHDGAEVAEEIRGQLPEYLAP